MLINIDVNTATPSRAPNLAKRDMNAPHSHLIDISATSPRENAEKKFFIGYLEHRRPLRWDPLERSPSLMSSLNEAKSFNAKRRKITNIKDAIT